MTQSLLSVQDVRKQFATVTAVDGVSLDVPQGAIFALLGPNGAGKTTLIRMLLGLIQPDSGAITFNGIRATSHGPHPADIGYLPEDRGLYADVSVVDTLMYFGALRGMQRSAARTAATEWLERMSLADRGGEPLKSLSKGNQQKIQFISAVLHRPAFAVLDEPFSGLDPLNQDLFLTLIHEIRAAGTTVLLSAHQMQLVERIADRIVVMNRGRTIVSGTLAEVRRQWTTGSRLVVRTAAPPPAGFMAEHAPRVTVSFTEPDAVELTIAEGEPLAPLLARIGAQLDVQAVESHAITLHDVYVGAIARHNASVASQEVA